MNSRVRSCRSAMRASWMGFLLGALVAAVQPAALHAQASDFDAVEIRTIEVAPGIAMLVGRGGNIGVSHGPDGVLLIDDQFAPLTQKIREAVAGLAAGEIEFVLNTHWHGDHTGGNAGLARDGATIVAHDNVRRRLARESYSSFFQRKQPAAPAAALPIITYGEDLTFHLNGQEIRVKHVAPAHTDGDSIVVFANENVIHTGDVFFNGLYPYIDLDAGGHPQGMIDAAERVLALADDTTRIIPGHGPLAKRSELVAFRDMLVGVRDRIRPAIAQGRSLDEIQAMKPTRDWDAKWGGGFLSPERFTELMVRGLAEPYARSSSNAAER